jgi:hypothetical protein
MSRCLTLEEYLQEFVDENTQSVGNEEMSLLVTDQQAQILGFFLINGLAGFVERVRFDKSNEQADQFSINDDPNTEEFIN